MYHTDWGRLGDSNEMLYMESMWGPTKKEKAHRRLNREILISKLLTVIKE